MKPEKVLTIENLARYLLWAMMLLIPLQSLWLRILEQHNPSDKLFFFASYWYEIGLFFLFAFTVISLLWLKIRLTTLDKVFLCLFGLAVISFFWAHHTLGEHIIGLRYSMLPVYSYWLARIAHFELKSTYRVLGYVFWVVIIVALLQLFLWVLLPNSPVITILAILPIDRVGTLFRTYGPLPGPNQFGSYLVLALVIGWVGQFRHRIFLSLFALLLIALSFSRGAALALGVVIIAYLIAERSKQAWQSVGISLAIFALIFFGFALSYESRLHDLFTHGASQKEHVTALQVGLDKFLSDGAIGNIVFGYGAGRAGPATFARGEQFIPESWYLQTLYEYGIAGLLLFLGIFWLTIKKAMTQQNKVVWLALIAMLANNLFLHVFSDNPAATSLLFILIGSLELGRCSQFELTDKINGATILSN